MKRPIYPLLLAVYPVLALFSYNIEQMKAMDALRALLVLLVGGVSLFFVLKLVLRNAERAALVFSILWVLFFSYGHVYNFLEGTSLFGLALGRHRLLIPLWAVLLVGGIWWALTYRVNLTRLTMGMNAVTALLLVFPLVQIASAEVRAQTAWSQLVPVSVESAVLQPALGQTPPDIYYIILDAYARGDVLQEVFGYDNSPFLEQLEGMGFYVAKCSQSNYAQTELSLASSLNFNYLEALGDSFTPSNNDRSPLRPLMQRSAARQLLESMGYQTVAFETGYSWSQWEDANVYLAPASQVGGLNGFEALLVKTSAGLVLTDAASVMPKFLVPDVNYPKQTHRERVLFTLDKLTSLPEVVNGPKFVFAHIIAPHEPFVFGPQGERIVISEPVDDATYLSAYRDQVIYLNQRVSALIQEIIQNSTTPPVIIIQADHGHVLASPEKRMQILNAFYLPGDQDQLLYPEITPVNTFRVIFNLYFGAHFELLEDHSYFSTYKFPYQLVEIPNECE